MSFSVNVLLYGDNIRLAERCLNSIFRHPDWSLITDVRFGINEVSPEVFEFIHRTAKELPVWCHVYSEMDGRNVGKYPLMRRMFFDTDERTLRASRVMWFDDDTFLTNATSRWWQDVSSSATTAHLLGKHYHMGRRGRQHLGIRQQPWYAGKEVLPQQRILFCQGGWWVADIAILRKWNYPFPELHHNGGDTLLGELCRQQDYVMRRFNTDVVPNADADGQESKSPRRGITTPWPWELTLVEDVSHQQFRTKVVSYPPWKSASAGST